MSVRLVLLMLSTVAIATCLFNSNAENGLKNNKTNSTTSIKALICIHLVISLGFGLKALLYAYQFTRASVMFCVCCEIRRLTKVFLVSGCISFAFLCFFFDSPLTPMDQHLLTTTGVLGVILLHLMEELDVDSQIRAGVLVRVDCVVVKMICFALTLASATEMFPIQLRLATAFTLAIPLLTGDRLQHFLQIRLSLQSFSVLSIMTVINVILTEFVVATVVKGDRLWLLLSSIAAGLLLNFTRPPYAAYVY